MKISNIQFPLSNENSNVSTWKFKILLEIGYWKLSIPFGIFLLDRILKGYAQHLPAGSVFSFLPGLRFEYFLNPSLFFFPAWSFIPWLALIVLIAIFGFWIWNLIGNWKLEIGNSLHHHLLLLLLGGGSNVFDRLAYGGVIDYVEILGLASANLADILILLGLFALLAHRGHQPHTEIMPES